MLHKQISFLSLLVGDIAKNSFAVGYKHVWNEGEKSHRKLLTMKDLTTLAT
jgi:hypothetical protein